MADNQFIARKGLISLDDSQITGSLSITNAVTASVFTGSFRGDGTNLYNIPSSGVTGLNLDKIISGSVSASISPNNGFRINTDVYIDGTITAKEFHTDYVTSSVLYQSGSTKFGDTLDDLHEFTGSVRITGSITLNGQAIGTGKLDETTFQSFTSSYNTGSFTGSFGGQFTGAASENLKYVGIWSGTTYGYYLVNDVVKYNNSLYVCNNNVFGNGTPDLDASFTLLSDITPTGSFLITSSFESFTGSYTTGSFTGSFIGDGSQLTGIDGFPFTGSAKITGSLAVTGSLTVDGNVNATSFTGSIQGTATTASYVNLTNVDGFTAYSSSVSSSINSVLNATTPVTATVNNTNSPLTITNQTIVIVDSTNGDVTINLPDLNTVVGTPNQRPIIIYKNDYSQNVVFVEPNGSQLVNGTTRDIIASIQIGIVYNPTSAGWVTEGTSYQSLAELELFFVPRTETGSLSVSTASYVEYTNVANKPSLVSGSSQISFNGITDKPTLVSGSSQISFNGITDKPTLVSGSSQITYFGLTGVPSGIVSGSPQITYSGLTGTPSGIVSGSSQVLNYGIFATTGSNAFIGTQTITGSLYISSDLVVQGSSSLQNITASAVNIGANIVNLNTANPAIRFAGLSIFDSGSIGGSGSFLYDAVQDEFIFIHRGDNSNITSSVVLMGPQTYNNVGSELYLTNNRVLKGTGNEHIVDSCIIDDGTTVCVNATLKANGQVCGVMGTFSCIGIGTLTPGSVLDLVGTCATLTITDNTSYATGVGGRISLHGNYRSLGDTTEGGYIKTSKSNSTNGDYGFDMIFATSNYTAGVSERLRITSTGVSCFGGNVCAPSFVLSNGNCITSIRNTGAAAIGVLGFTSGTDTLFIKGGTSGAAASIQFQDTGGTIATFYNCRLGIGTTTPGTALEVVSRAADADRTIPHNVLTLTAEQGNSPYGFFGGAILFKNRSYTSGLVESARIRSVIYDDGAPANCGGGLWFETTPTPGGTLTPSLVLDYQGRLGIGTSCPSSTYGRLTVAGTGISIADDGNAKLQIGRYNASVCNAYIKMGSNACSLRFTNAADTIDVFVMEKCGNIGVGTSSPNIYGLGFTKQFTISNTDSSQYANFTIAGGSNASGGVDFGNQTIRHSGVYGLDGSALGLYTNGSNSGSGLTERLRITSCGNILINQACALTGVPTSIEMSGVGSSTATSQASYNVFSYHGATNTTWRGYYVFHKSRGTTVGSAAAVANEDYLGTLRWNGTDGSGEIITSEINAIVDGTVSTNVVPSRMVFSTMNSSGTIAERMRITSGGQLRVIGVGNSLAFDTDGSGASTLLFTNGQYDFRIANSRGGASNIDVSTYEIGFGMNGSTNRYRMGNSSFYPAGDNAYTLGYSGQRWSAIWSANGTIQTSDARQKKDIETSNLGLEFINKLRPVSYKWKVGKNVVTVDGEIIDETGAKHSNDVITPVSGTRTHYGLIAQEVKEALGDTDFGGYVHDENTDTMALRYDQFVAPLIKAIQEQQEQIEILKAEIQTLKQ